MNLKSKIKTLRYALEAAVVKFALWIFYLMGEQRASDVGAAIAKFVGKKIPVHRLAYRNLSNAIPELSEQEKEKILDGMWDNLGRVVGEYPHVSRCPFQEIGKYIEVPQETADNLEAARSNNKGGILFSGHIANWEIGSKVFLKYGLDVSAVYRPLNNPYVEEMTAGFRGTKLIEKGPSGSRKIIEILKAKKFVMIMADQKISEGEPVQFFHDVAATTTSMARIALKYDVPLIPVRAIRIGNNFKFIVDVEKPLAIHKSSDLNSDVLRLTRQVNLKLEEWIKQYPSQWFWVHNRWKK